jgi:hypothetical protein
MMILVLTAQTLSLQTVARQGHRCPGRNEGEPRFSTFAQGWLASSRIQSGVLKFIPLRSGIKHPLREAWDAVQPDLLRVAAAFSTESGAQEFRNRIIGSTPFDAIDKRWLIGIQQGVTQPEALGLLGSLPSSEVRVPFGLEALASPTLRAPTFFHAKAYYFENSSTGEIRLLSSSANLTYRGLRTSVEQFLAWSGGARDAEADSFNDWWTTLWSAANVADNAFINAYEVRRPVLPTPANALTTGPADSVLQRAQSFWIELTRKPEGGSFNQVELLFNGHFFFYPDTSSPRSDVHRPLTFEDPVGNRYEDPGRRVMYNGPPLKPGGNHMWRVYLPTAGQGLSGYQDGDAIVRFERTDDRDHYLIEIAPSRSPQALAWIDSAAGVAEHGGAVPRRMGWS